MSFKKRQNVKVTETCEENIFTKDTHQNMQ